MIRLRYTVQFDIPCILFKVSFLLRCAVNRGPTGMAIFGASSRVAVQNFIFLKDPYKNVHSRIKIEHYFITSWWQIGLLVVFSSKIWGMPVMGHLGGIGRYPKNERQFGNYVFV